MWPVSPPEELKIHDRFTEFEDNITLDINDNEILQTVPVPQANILIMLTPGRVLVYNFKPLALVATHERTAESIVDFGVNVRMSSSVVFIDEVEGLVSRADAEYLPYHKGKIVFYVSTDKNYLLAYQILKNATNLVTFRDFGIPVVAASTKCKKFNPNEEDTRDDNTLTVVQKNNQSMVIQNGYLTKRGKGFFQNFKMTVEAQEELAVKRLELRLKVILKFDHEIIDFLGFKNFDSIDKETLEENLLLLFPHGLQIIHFNNFKVQKSELVKVNDGKKIIVVSKHLFVISETNGNETIINEIDIVKRHAFAKDLKSTEKLISSFQYKDTLTLVKENKIEFYKPKSSELITELSTNFKIKFCDRLTNNVLLLISNKNSMYLYSEFGNLLFSTEIDEDNTYGFDYSDFAYYDMRLIAVSKTGHYQSWNFWQELPQSHYDFNSPTSFVVHNLNNDISLYSTSVDPYAKNDILLNLKLPTRTVNNCVPIVRINSNSTLIVAYVSNKNILLVQNVETGIWYPFLDQIIIDFQWLGNNYLVCHIKKNGNNIIRCLRLPLEGLDKKSFMEYVIWEHSIPNDINDFRFVVNTLFRHKQIKKKRPSSEADNNTEDMFKTGEIILLFDNYITVIDVISIPHASGINVIKKFHQYLEINIPPEISMEFISWITNYKDGLLVYAGSKIYKVVRGIKDEDWKVEVLLDRVERIIDVLKDDIYLIQNKCVQLYTLENIWNMKKKSLAIPVDDDFYPISVLPESATLHGIHIIYRPQSTKCTVKHDIYLDKLLSMKLSEGIDPSELSAQYGTLKHYYFALEKILSQKILDNEPLDGIIKLIKKTCEVQVNGFIRNDNTNLLEIISNCLRKIETKHWNYLFQSLELTPKDLLALCIESNDVKLLGVLLLVFLNYNESDLVDNLREEMENNEPQLKDVTGERQESSSTVANVLRDEQLMLEVLRLLVTGAAASSDKQKASESWDMCFQLIRLLKELDKENKTQLVNKAMSILT
ncbi:hypothetical protein Kpol_1046p5 [Vanderwaltozyma polyspora DSM 70294]|uniref:RIC1 C-terminal alpha solenoid region domain-containing protein n=1 Tax=Vanderwaltozyma polyspora (strain ATCC 22028 / DSM 70294 / BCRC 21397 / CBS 2163 / NBRC 10782 / NRRL Y-8283 / UCD 57-17) TaxID=436907 RepID=A7TRI6_VANPO|nr:uncharacterized protein Kpol_1046p5 [Vanderwaltozyma polyspora DSM 70294]EDO15115.1 hypothetical protein Kpol_1046p5 [Vanderwaltozyma polyspora DSM 70294]